VDLAQVSGGALKVRITTLDFNGIITVGVNGMPADPICVLLIEDNPGEARLIERMLEGVWESPFEVQRVDRLSAGLDHLVSARADVVLLDLSLPDSRGFDTFVKTQAQAPQVPIIVLTGLDDEELAVKAVRQGAQDYLVKAEVIEGQGNQLMRAMRYAIERKRTERALRESQEEIRRRAAHLEALNAIIALATAADDLTDLLDTTLDHALQALQLDRGAIWLADQMSLRGFPPDVDLHLFQFRAGQSPLPEVAAVEDWQQIRDSEDLAAPVSIAERLDVRASLSVPILAEGRPIGGLSLAAPEPRPWSVDEVALVEALGRQIGAAAERLRLLDELYHQAEELEASVRQLQELDRLKSEFVQNVSHELRSPLALILGYAELLVDGDLGPLTTGQRGPMEIISRRAHMLSELVEDITLILLSDGRSLAEKQVNWADLARAAANDFRVMADQAGLTLEVEIPIALPAVQGDAIYLRRVIDNLLSNAIKFTPDGGTITVCAYAKDDQVVLQVADTGIGIAPKDQERIFERFYQVNGSARRRYGGVGLGLALVKELVESHGGQISVQSQGVPGQGSIFTVTLPIAES
jgi:signal transduction histidine kinase/DNA-binding response OmpR family regulator